MEKEQILPKKDYRLNWFILKNFKGLTRPFIEKNKYRGGVGKKKEALINHCQEALNKLAECKNISHSKNFKKD